MKHLLSQLLLSLALFAGTGAAQTPVKPEFIGQTTHSIGGVTANSIMTETDQSANGRRWLQTLNGGVLKFQVSTDNGATTVDWLRVTRSGNTITSVEFPKINLVETKITSNGVLNWGATAGESGYGIRDNSGTLEYKNNAGLWQAFNTPAPAGGGWTDSGTTIQLTTGTDAVLVGNWNKIRGASVMSGATAGAQLASAMADLPSTGGVIEAAGFEGTGHAISADPFSGVTKPVHILLGAATYTISTSFTVPANVTIEFRQGSSFSINVGVVVTWEGSIKAPMAQIFSGSGTVTFPSARVKEVYPEWWGAKADGQYGLDCTMTSGAAGLTISNGLFRSSMVGQPIVVYGAGASSANLVTTIAGFTDSNTVTLTANAGTSTSTYPCVWATDDTAALQAALNAHLRVVLSDGVYGYQVLRIRQGQQLVGTGMESTKLLRVGTTGTDYTTAAFAMQTGNTAEFLKLENFAVWCNNLGAGVNCVELGTQTPGTTDFGSASVVHNIRVTGPSGVGFRVRSNAPGNIVNLWIMNTSAYGSVSVNGSSRAFESDGATLNVDGLHPEGAFANGDVVFGHTAGMVNNVDLELQGSYGTKDAITISAPNSVSNIFIYGPSATRRDLIRITAEYTGVRSFFINQSGGAITASSGYGINNTVLTETVPATQFYVPFYDSVDSSNLFSQRIYPNVNLYRNFSMLGVTPTITLSDSGGSRPFALSNSSDTFTVRDTVNAVNNITAEAGGRTVFGGAIRPKTILFADRAAHLTVNGDEIFCSDCKGPNDGSYVAGWTCAGSGGGALARRVGGQYKCY
jgi:hypothetical protein